MKNPKSWKKWHKASKHKYKHHITFLWHPKNLRIHSKAWSDAATTKLHQRKSDTKHRISLSPACHLPTLPLSFLLTTLFWPINLCPCFYNSKQGYIALQPAMSRLRVALFARKLGVEGGEGNSKGLESTHGVAIVHSKHVLCHTTKLHDDVLGCKGKDVWLRYVQ